MQLKFDCRISRSERDRERMAARRRSEDATIRSSFHLLVGFQILTFKKSFRIIFGTVLSIVNCWNKRGTKGKVIALSCSSSPTRLLLLSLARKRRRYNVDQGRYRRKRCLRNCLSIKLGKEKRSVKNGQTVQFSRCLFPSHKMIFKN